MPGNLRVGATISVDLLYFTMVNSTCWKTKTTFNHRKYSNLGDQNCDFSSRSQIFWKKKGGAISQQPANFFLTHKENFSLPIFCVHYFIVNKITLLSEVSCLLNSWLLFFSFLLRSFGCRRWLCLSFWGFGFWFRLPRKIKTWSKCESSLQS